MQDNLSESARRAVAAARRWAVHLAANEVEPVHLLLAIAAEEESRGARMLRQAGFQLAPLAARLGVAAPAEELPPADPRVPLSEAVRAVLIGVPGGAQGRAPADPPGTDVLLRVLLGRAPELGQLLAELGADAAGIAADLEQQAGLESAPLPPEFEELELSDGTDTVDAHRILDAAANRAREGLRVLEDHARFAWDDAGLAAELKGIRHRLREALGLVPYDLLLEARDTEHDVGTTISTPSEWVRPGPLDVVTANFKRTQEALRTLEEYGKTQSRRMAEAVERERYRLYTVERVALLGAASRSRLDGIRLYLLIGSDQAAAGLDWTLREALAGGVQMVQLRQKGRPDRELLGLARGVRQLTGQAGCLFIMNDRPDLARLAQADGVHLGQEELSVRDARRIVGPGALIGVSTHSIEQARAAVRDGASYIGVGPVFPSPTKTFREFPGVELVRQVSAEVRLPAFAIGGISAERLGEVLAAGASRVAVSSAVSDSPDPRAAACELRQRLNAAAGSSRP